MSNCNDNVLFQHAVMLVLACSHVRFHWSLEVFEEERIQYVFRVCTFTLVFVFVVAGVVWVVYVSFWFFKWNFKNFSVEPSIWSDVHSFSALYFWRIWLKKIFACLYKFLQNRSLLELALTHPSYRTNYGTNRDHARNTLLNCGIRCPKQRTRDHSMQQQLNTHKRGRRRWVFGIFLSSNFEN